MGVVSSCCIPRRSCECGRSGTMRTPGEKQRRNLSATFNLSVSDDRRGPNPCLVDINMATEEELMTLQNIDRPTARNIIEHRKHIGGFRYVEDIALVSGVGAVKYAQVRDDIYIPSLDRNSNDAGTRGINGGVNMNSKYSTPVVSINTANIFSLIKVKGIGMTVAKNIIDHRDKYGKFNCLEELKKVKGIGPQVFDNIRSWLTVDDRAEKKQENNVQNNGKINHWDKEYTQDISHVQRSPSIENLLEVLGPLATVPVRPQTKPVKLKYKNKKVFRLATWNLQSFSKEKASNPGVKDVVCMTILENRFGIIAVQELGDKEALHEICQELNSPTLPNVKKWKGRQGKWKCVVSDTAGRMFQSMEYHGFLYDESQNIELISASLLQTPSGANKPFTRMPYLSVFKINDAFDCIIVSVHLKATGLDEEHKDRTEAETDRLYDVIQAVNKQIRDEEDVIILGDFNLSPESKAFDDLRQKGYTPCIISDVFTNISNSNPLGSENYDNIWLSRQTKCLMTDTNGVVRDGLHSPWIPNGWTWGGVVSDHCPVYTQLYACIDLDKDGDVMSAKEASFVIGTDTDS